MTMTGEGTEPQPTDDLSGLATVEGSLEVFGEWANDMAAVDRHHAKLQEEIVRHASAFGQLSKHFEHAGDTPVPLSHGAGTGRGILNFVLTGAFHVRGTGNENEGLWHQVTLVRQPEAEQQSQVRHYIYYETGKQPNWEMAHLFTVTRKPIQG